MGGTYKLSNFENRQSQYPTRRRLNPVAGQDNIYDVIREEGNVTAEGTPWGATTMNNFDKKISSMFPVSIANGGTGGTTKNSAINNLITSGQFTPNLYSSNKLTEPLHYSSSNPGFRQGYYYKLGRFVYVDMVIRDCKGYETDPTGYIYIGRLPYPAAPGHQSGLPVPEFSLTGTGEDRNRRYTTRIINGESFLRVETGDGGNALPVSAFGTGSESTSFTLNMIVCGVYITN